LAGKAFFAEFDYQISLPLEIRFGPISGPSKAIYQLWYTFRCNETPFKNHPWPPHYRHVTAQLVYAKPSMAMLATAKRQLFYHTNQAISTKISI